MSMSNVEEPRQPSSIDPAPSDRFSMESGISRRHLLRSAGALGAGSLLASSDKGLTSARSSAAAQEEIEIVVDVSTAIQEDALGGDPGEGNFGSWWEVQVFTSHLQKYADEHPGVSVSTDWFEGRPISEKIFARKTAGQLGDIVHGLSLPLDVAARNEIYRPLDELIESANFDLTQYTPNVIDFLRFNPATGNRGAGEPLYALPTQGNPGAVILFYNADMFAKKGVAAPTSDMGWDALVETANQMTERKEGADVADVYGWLVSPYWFADVYTTWLRDFGADMFDESGTRATLDTTEAKEFLTFVYDAIYTQGFSPRPDILASVGQYKNMFLQQNLAMFRLPPWGVLATTDLPREGEDGYFEWGAIAMPAGPSGQRGTSLGSAYIGLSAESENPTEAFDVLAWVTNQDAGVFQCFNAGMCTPRPDVYNDPRVEQSEYLQMVNPIISDAIPPVRAANGRDSEAIDALGTEFDKLINDQVKPDDEFFSNMNQVVQDILDQSPG